MSFSGLELARRALAAHQVRISVISQNITNSASEGYSRQTVTLSAVGGTLGVGGAEWLGGGVEVSAVERQRDAFIDRLIQYEGGRTAQWQELSTGLERLEAIMQEPEGGGLSEPLSEFWEAWDQVATMPESLASRAALREKASVMISQFQSVDQQLSMYAGELRQRVDTLVWDVNSLSEQVAALNVQITRSEARGQSTAALCDKRDLLVDNLAQVVGARLNVMGDGSVQVLLGTRALVDGATVHHLESAPDASGGQAISWTEDPPGTTIDTEKLGGQLRGLTELLETKIPGLQTRVRTLAGAVYEAVNAQHQLGYGLNGSTGNDFFTLDAAATFSINAWQVNPAFETAPELIAAAELGGGPADGRNAASIAGIAAQALAALGGTDPMEYHRGTLAELGVTSGAASQLYQNEQVITNDLRSKRDMISGVNMDEELTNLVEAEHAYAAAAKLVGTMDSILDTIVNDIGAAGH